MADKCAVVTGASKGIGLEIAKGLLADGYRVFGFARSRAEVSDIDWIRCDVTDSQSVTDAFKQVIEQAGKLDLLVVNAGMGISGAAEFAGEADYRRQFEVNVFGAIACAKAKERKDYFHFFSCGDFSYSVSELLCSQQSGGECF